MPNFIKIPNHPNWFLLIQTESDIPENLDKQTQEQMESSSVLNYLYADDKSPLSNPKDIAIRLKVIQTTPLYKERLEKYGPILVRPNGSWMTFDPLHTPIIEKKESFSFPTDSENPDIVVCENDTSAPTKWLDYLNKRFPGKSIRVINYFRTREAKEIAYLMGNCQIVTFSTTFSSMDWVELLAEALPKPFTGVIIGETTNPEQWEEAVKILYMCPKIEKFSIF